MTIKYPDVAFPPPNIKSLIDRTAEMIVRNEPILSLSAHKSRLSFLNQEDKYFSYFIMKMEQLENELYDTDDDMDSDIDDNENDSDEQMLSDNDDDDESDCDDSDDSDNLEDDVDEDGFGIHRGHDEARRKTDGDDAMCDDSEIHVEL